MATLFSSLYVLRLFTSVKRDCRPKTQNFNVGRLIHSFDFIFLFVWKKNSETPVVEKEVVEVDAPKVVDEEESNEVVENGNGEEAAAPAESAENGSTEETANEEVTSAEEVDVQNGDSTGKCSNHKNKTKNPFHSFKTIDYYYFLFIYNAIEI